MQPPARMRRAQIEAGQPLRKHAYYRGSFGKPGWYYMASVGRLVSYESKLEAWVLLDIDFSGDCAEILQQPCRLHFGTKEPPYSHIPDFLYRTTQRQRVLVDVKGALAAERPRNAATFAMTRAICDDLGWEFRLAHEPAAAYFHNIRFLGSVRTPAAADALEPFASMVAEFVQAHDHVPWGAVDHSLRQDIPDHLRPRAIARAAWNRWIVTDLATPLNEASLLTSAENTHRLRAVR